MAIENPSAARDKARTAAAAVVAVVALLAGCDGGGSTPYRTGSTVGTGSSAADSTAATATASASDETGSSGNGSGPTSRATTRTTAFPSALVGEWSGDDAQGVGSWDLRFDAGGHYVFQNDRRGRTVTGSAYVQGSQIVIQPDGGQPYAESVRVSGGHLELDGRVYLRTDAAAGGATAVVGSWLSLENTYETLTLTEDGGFQLEDQTKGRATGTYTVSGSTLVLTTRAGIVRVPFSISDGTLTVGWPDGTPAQYVRS